MLKNVRSIHLLQYRRRHGSDKIDFSHLSDDWLFVAYCLLALTLNLTFGLSTELRYSYAKVQNQLTLLSSYGQFRVTQQAANGSAVVNIYPSIPLRSNVQMEGAMVHMKMDNSQALSDLT